MYELMRTTDQVNTDGVFSTPLSPALESDLPVLISSRAKEDCVLLRFALADVSEAALARKRAQVPTSERRIVLRIDRE